MGKDVLKKISIAIVLFVIIVACNKDINVTGVSLNKDNLTLIVGETTTLTVTVSPADATDKTVSWTSSVPAVASVNNGIVTALEVGTTTIIVTTNDGNYTAKCEVMVEGNAVKVTDVTLDQDNLTLVINETATLIATVLPSDATDKTVSWTSSDPDIAEIDNGVITANETGVATITVTTNDGNFTAICMVLVIPEWIEINGVKWATRNIDAPGTFTKRPEDAGMFYQWNSKIGWSNSDPLINSDGGVTWDNSLVPVGDSWEKINDPSPEGWRLPTRTELQSLMYSGGEGGVLNGVFGRYFGSGDAVLFLPAAGGRTNDDGTLHKVGSFGMYWSDTPILPTSTFLYYMYFFENFVNTDDIALSKNGFSLRCVLVE